MRVEQSGIATPPAGQPTRWGLWTGIALAAVVTAALLAYDGRGTLGDPAAAGATFQRFSTAVVGVFIEAMPFILIGVLLSALFVAFVGMERLYRLFPKQRFGAMAVASVLGVGFPICDCGLIPIGRSMIRHGIPAYVALTFMLAAPIMNPIVFWSTWTAFGNRPGLVLLRFGIALAIAWTVGLLAATVLRRQRFLAAPVGSHGVVGVGGALAMPLVARGGGPVDAAHPAHDDHAAPGAAGVPLLARLRGVLVSSSGELIEMATFLAIGAVVAAAIQVLLPRTTLLGLATGPVLSVAILMALRAMVSVCAAVDAFLALAFASVFSPGALVAFMIVGPVFDVKNAFMIGGTFDRSLLLVYLLVVTPLIFLAGVTINLLFPAL